MDSSGIGSIVNALRLSSKWAQREAGEAGSPCFQDIQNVRHPGLFSVYESEADAVARVAAYKIAFRLAALLRGDG